MKENKSLNSIDSKIVVPKWKAQSEGLRNALKGGKGVSESHDFTTKNTEGEHDYFFNVNTMGLRERTVRARRQH